jgi:hypothetical protein
LSPSSVMKMVSLWFCFDYACIFWLMWLLICLFGWFVICWEGRIRN